ncbi:MAG: DUF3106 domain-containing protein [Bryobacteraceae bacterium]|nr:DUF3106 domain-containing protein [Bryobacteraceae bacterium]
MTRTLTLFVLLLLSVNLTFASPGKEKRESSVPPHLTLERLNRMTPEEREQLLSRMPRQRRLNFEDRLERFRSLPEPVRERLRLEYNNFQQLPPEKQDTVRKLFRRFSDIPEERRADVRRELARLRKMSPERRSKIMESPEFQADFNEMERELLAGLTANLPPVELPPARQANPVVSPRGHRSQQPLPVQ